MPEIEENTPDDQPAVENAAVPPETTPMVGLEQAKEVTKSARRLPRLTKKTVIITILTALVVGGAAAAFLVMRNNKPEKIVSSGSGTSVIVDPASSQTDTTPAVAKALDTITSTGNTYFAAAKDLGDLNFFKDPGKFGEQCDTLGKNCAAYTASTFKYYQVGTTKDGKAIITTYTGIGADYGPPDYTAIETAPKTYQILAQLDPSLKTGLTSTTPCTDTDMYCPSTFSKNLSQNVTLDTKTVLAELNFPTEVTVNGQKLKKDYEGNGYFTKDGQKNIRGSYFGDLKSDQSVQKIGTSGDYTFYEVSYKTTDTYKIQEIYAMLGGVYAFVYKPNGELASTTADLPITWSSGETGNIQAFSGGAGCGSIGYVVANNVSTSSLKQVGTTKAGQKIYQLPNDNALVTELYTTDYAQGTNAPDGYKNLTLQQFTDKHAYFLVQNGLNEYVVFQRNDVFIRGGCGKPVIYLYPTAPTDVSVRVGAEVVKSEPGYGTSGWQHVFARPNGSLSFAGKNYDSLYWEGYGDGPYPDITSGTVVKSADAVNTIKTQLAAQGLNAKETADFLAYWQPKLPSTPYVRLTWFSTAQMNRLAPLAITPAPQTTIRTFLDFEGLQQPVALAPQTFRQPKRQGFTVVEWGGLLREGIR